MLQKFCYETGPAGLVARSQSLARVSMEEFVEQYMVPEVWIFLEEAVIGVYRAPSVCIRQEERREAP